MAEYINSVDLLGDEVVANSFIDRSIVEFRDDTVTKLKGSSFYNCRSLKLVDLSHPVGIPNYTFYGSANIEAVILRSKELCDIGDQTVFTGNKFYFYVPKELLETYKVTGNWTKYVDRLRAIEDYPEICGG